MADSRGLTTSRVNPGLYAVRGSVDAEGKPYQVRRVRAGSYPEYGTGTWLLQDSRRRPVSLHLTINDAVSSCPDPQGPVTTTP